MFSWRLVKPADDSTDVGADDTLPNFTFFIPETENAKFAAPKGYLPAVGKYPATNDPDVQFDLNFSLPGGHAQAIADARSEIMALQSGTANIPFPGYDFTPSFNDRSKDWTGPGPISIASPTSKRPRRAGASWLLFRRHCENLRWQLDARVPRSLELLSFPSRW
jgi:hypothetical protein